ncbi:hypothetical protein [Methylobacterium sp.]|jgi:hypothetical protein|uniref:hypothetical protein n=1 Tax=Methylobacterium sp. TaxID=409 RepID=UPI0025E5E2E5|nr:hypothetical protein [Methylobacterium sp.]MBY0256928.1 hypothetical protein [Methylobacterium sp.]
MERNLLIWSNERGMWWKASRYGYTTLTHEAGRFSQAEADQILAAANVAAEPGRPNEVACIAPWRTWAAEEFQHAATLHFVSQTGV